MELETSLLVSEVWPMSAIVIWCPLVESICPNNAFCRSVSSSFKWRPTLCLSFLLLCHLLTCVSLIRFVSFHVPQSQRLCIGYNIHHVVERINEIKQVKSWHRAWKKASVDMCYCVYYLLHPPGFLGESH